MTADPAPSRCFGPVWTPWDRTTLARLAKLVAADVAAGQPGPNSQAVSDFLEAQPEAVLDLLDMLLAEARRKRRNEKLITAYGTMVGQALEYTRYAVEGGFTQTGAAAKSRDRDCTNSPAGGLRGAVPGQSQRIERLHG